MSGEWAVPTQYPASATVSVIVYKLTINVSPGFCVPGATPARWGVPVGLTTDSVQLLVDTLPESIDLSAMSIAWTGASTDPDYPQQAFLPRGTTGASDVSVSVTDDDNEVSSAAAQVVVVGIDHLASDDSNLIEAGDGDNAMTGVAASPATVTVRALLTPSTPDVSAVTDKLLVWLGVGQPGASADRRLIDRSSPEKTRVIVRCGTSEDTLTVWAVKVTLNIGGLTAAQKMVDANAVPITRNSDDDNHNGVPDMNESNGALDLGIVGENKLVAADLDVQPRGVPVGTLALELPSGNQFAVCANDDKSGGQLTPSWSLDAGPAPCGIYLEGLTTCGPQTLTLSYTFGHATISTDSAKVQCVAPQTDYHGDPACAFFRVYSAGQAGGGTQMQASQVQRSFSSVQHSATLFPVRNGAVGGSSQIMMGMELPAMTWLFARQAQLEVVDDQYPDQIHNDQIYVSFETSVWYNYDPSTSPEEWTFYYRQLENNQQAPGLPLYLEGLSIAPLSVCTLVPWDTAHSPSLDGYVPAIGTNGPHTLRMIARERMANYWESVSGLPYAFVNGVDGGDIRETNGPAPLTVNVQNLVVSDLSAEKGTVDYFKYDPNPSSPFHRPSISFTVEDTLEAGHHYEYNIFVQPTTNSGFAVLQKEGAYSWLVGNFATPDKMTVTWYGSRFPDYTQDTAGWGTYTYDVGVIEYDQSGNIVDWFNSKWPYCLSVGDHDVWWNFSGDSAKLKTNYILHDYANKNNFSIQRLPVEVSITAIDGSMNEVNNMQIDKEIDHFYNGNTGEGITSFECKESDVDWSNRVIYTAIDDCWKFYRRDHEAVVMLAQNRVVSYILALNYVGRNKFDWAGLLLAEYWINGGGVARNIINDPYWSAYIKAKKKIQNFCHQQLLETEELNNCSLHNQSHTHTNKYIYGASLGTGDTYFGYDVLGEAGHALHYGGNLSINGQNYDANLWYTWHDMMDLHPNVFKNGYGTDIPRWIFGGCIGAQYYELKITWYDDSTFQIITDQAGAKRLWPLSGWLRANINSPYQAQLDQNIAALEDTKWQAYQTLIYKWTQSVLAILPCKSTTYYELILSPPGYDIFDYKYGRFVFGKVKTGLSIISDDGTTMILREGYPVNSDINTIRKEYTIPSFPSPLAVP